MTTGHSDHAHAGHAHAHGLRSGQARGDDRRRLGSVLALALAFACAELAGGIWTGSLALLADAFHLVSDVAALALSLFAAWISGRPASLQRTFGHSRAEILAALANGVGLAAAALAIIWGALRRLDSPTPIDGLGVVAFASAALCYEAISLRILHAGASENLNVRSAFLHVASDALGSLGAIFSGLAIWAYGWSWADPLASLLISALVLHAAWRLVREALDVLMEAAPGHLDVAEIRDAVAALPAVASVHDLHIWRVGSGDVCLSTHVVVPGAQAGPGVLSAVRRLLRERFAIAHTTIQIETPDERDDDATSSECVGACRD